MIRTTVGVECAGNDLRIAVIRSSFGKLRLKQYCAIPGFAELGHDEQESALAKLVKEQKIPGARVFFAMSREHGVVRQLELPLEVSSKLRSVITLQLESLCPWLVDDVYWDFAHDDGKLSGKFLTVTIVIIPKAVLDPWIGLFRSAKLPLSGATLCSLASAHAVASMWSDSVPTIVLDCEANYVEGAFVQGNRLGSLSLRGDAIPQQAKTIVERLLSQGRVASRAETRLIAYGAAMTEVDAGQSPALPIEDAQASAAHGFGAIATSLSGIHRTLFGVNLVPKHLRYRQNQVQLIPTYVLLLLTAVLGIGLLVRNSYQLSTYAARIDDEIQILAPQVRDVALQEAQLNNLSLKHRVLTNHFQSRDTNLELLRDLARSLPPDAWLSNYAYQDGSVSISGFANASAEVQRAIEDSPLFKEATFTSPVTRDPSGKDRFTLKAGVEVMP